MKLQNVYLDLKLGPHVKEIMAVHIYIYYEYCLYIWSVSAIYPPHELLSTRWMTILWTTSKNYWIYKRKKHIRIRSIDVLLWIHDYGVTCTSFSSGFPEENYLTNYNTRFHSCIRNICYQVHWGNFIEFTLTLTPCPF